MKTQLLIKAIIATLFFLALMDMPYSYYQIAMFVWFVGFGVIAYLGYKDKRWDGVIIGIAGAIFFNPLYKVTFEREEWQAIDLCLGAFMTGWILFDVAWVLIRKWSILSGLYKVLLSAIGTICITVLVLVFTGNIKSVETGGYGYYKSEKPRKPKKPRKPSKYD